MNTPRFTVWLVVLIISVGCFWLRSPSQAVAGDSPSEVPSIIQDGFRLWHKQGAIYALDAWQKGGLLEGDRKVDSLSSYFKRIDRAIGSYRSYEVIETRRISPSSQILYVSLNFQHAAIYGRFLLYRTEKDWVVQSLDFSLKPETIMPWLAFGGVNDTE